LDQELGKPREQLVSRGSIFLVPSKLIEHIAEAVFDGGKTSPNRAAY
jgi:hypothetical protein